MASSERLLSGGVMACVVGAGLILAAAGPAFAYTACNGDGDCWHTDTRVHFPGVSLTFHNDKWADTHRKNSRYHWHDTDAARDWHHGYWSNGEWHAA
jgi:hypothetical protein